MAGLRDGGALPGAGLRTTKSARNFVVGRPDHRYAGDLPARPDGDGTRVNEAFFNVMVVVSLGLFVIVLIQLLVGARRPWSHAMKLIRGSERRTKLPAIPLLENGERMKQPEFHRRYQAYPDHVKIELIGGIVFMASPQRLRHSRSQPEVSAILLYYKTATPGTELLDNATTILDEDNEPQPDLSLRILPEFGGQSHEDKDEYLVGAPELVVEIAHSTRSLDLNEKRATYKAAGVKEYLVVCLEQEELRWFDFRADKELKPDGKGMYCSRIFPGLWIDGPALIARNTARLIEVVQQGLAGKAHAAFVKRLERRRKKGA